MFLDNTPSNLLVVFLFGIFYAIGGSQHEAGYPCYKGCHKSFKPVCGADGQTYSNGCVATCQGVVIAHSGSCPGESILHLANTYVVNGSAEANMLPPQHLNVFKHEGYRYAGQLSFSPEMTPRHHKRQENGSPGMTQQQQQGQHQLLRAVRATREGHVYVADMDESVDMVLNKLLEVHANSTTSASHVASLLRSLQHWRMHGSRDAGSRHAGSSSGSKWSRQQTVVAKEGPGEHMLQPGLDTEGAASGFVAQGAVDQGSQKKKREASGGQDVTSGRRGRDGDVESGKPRSGRDAKGGVAGQHRQTRRSLGVFDTDDRMDCPRTVTYPFTAVGQINVHDSSGNYVCSGVLVGPDVVLTAAHCVFSRTAQTFFGKLDFAPSRYRTLDGKIVNPFGVVPWSYVTMYQTYSSPTTPDPNTEDIAVITLSQRIGTQAGWMGVFEPCSPYAPSRYVVLTAGYPSDQLSGSCKTTQCVVVQDPCTDGYLYHKCDTAAGQSGSPMYMMAMTAARKMGPYVRAVHNIEWMQETSNGQMVSYINSGVSITPDHYRSILAWIGLSFTSDGSTTPMGPALPPASSLTSHH